MIVLAASHGVQGALLGPVGFIVAIFVGMVSFFSPCVLPLLPGYLSYVSGLSGEEFEVSGARKRVLAGTGLFVLGFATMFSALGAVASFIGSFLADHLSVINRVAGAIVIMMGLAFLLPSLVPFLERERRPFLSHARPGLAGAYPLGLAFAAGWAPCVGPGLGVMLTLGATQGGAARGALLLFFFSMGFGVWFLLAALGIRRAVGASSWLRTHMRGLQIVGGTLMVAIGLLLVTNEWANVIAPFQRMFTPPV